MSAGSSPERPARRRWLIAGGLVAALAVAFVAFDLHGRAGGHAHPGPRAGGVTGSPPVLSPEPPVDPAAQTAVFARVKGLSLQLPAARFLVVAYHEASSDATLALTPAGRCTRDANRYKFTKPPATPGPRYIVMSSRGRPHPATSAADIAMRPGTTVVSPVTGIVTKVRTYRLYGRYPDLRITVTPQGRPNLRVIMLHVMGLRVHRGDPVTAGVTAFGTPRLFRFRSQVNDYVGPGIPHVHIEVKLLGPSGR